MAAAMPFVWGEGGEQLTPDAIARRRKIAEAMLSQGGDYSPVQHWTQGAARVTQALMGGMLARDADQADKANAAADKEMVSKWFGGGTPPIASSTSTEVPPVSTPAPTVLGANGQPSLPDAQGVYAADATMMPPTAVASTGGNVPRGIRNNNPLNIEAGSFTQAQPGFSGSDGRFARFATPEQGISTAAKLLDTYSAKYGLNTVAGIVGRWAPAAENGAATSNYAAAVARDMGVDPNAPIDLRNPSVKASLIGAMGKFENGQPIEVPGLGEQAMAFSGEPAALPPNATPTAGAAPPAVQAPAPAVASVAGAMGNINPGVVSALTSPYTSDATKKIAQIVLQHQLQGDAVTTVDLGNSVGVMDKRGNLIKQLPKGEPNKGPEYGVIGKDAFGNEQYGWKNPRDQSVTPYNAAGGQPAATPTVTGPDGAPIPIPAGVNPKKFRDDVTGATADAATGKKTEVQAKSEKFGNKMELAERNLSSIESSGQSLVGRALEGNEWIPGSQTIGNLMQSETYQKYRQARDNFITALLRDESGAAIGTKEFVRYEKELFPQPGDGPKVIEQKREARKVAIEAMKKSAGPGYKSPAMEAPAAAPSGIDPKVWAVMTPEERALWKS